MLMYMYTLNPIESNHRDGPIAMGHKKNGKDNYMKMVQVKRLLVLPN